MLIIYGKRDGKIKSFIDNQQQCDSCKNFGLKIIVRQEYYHLYHIPFAPVGNKFVFMRCVNCDDPVRNYSIEQSYINKTRSPWYYYSVPLLLVLLILLVLFGRLFSAKNKAAMVAEPKLNDVYLISENSGNQYYFLKIVATSKDSVYTLHNNFMYTRYTSEMSYDDDFIATDTIGFRKSTLIEMLEDGAIVSVDRN